METVISDVEPVAPSHPRWVLELLDESGKDNLGLVINKGSGWYRERKRSIEA